MQCRTLKKRLRKTMNVSDEDIESAMEQLGIIAEDLLDMQKLTDLVVALSGNTDSLEFLTDADSVSMLNDILEYAKSVTDNLEDVYNMDIDSIKEMLVSAKDDVKQSVKQSVVKEDAQPEERPEATSQYELSNVIAQKTKKYRLIMTIMRMISSRLICLIKHLWKMKTLPGIWHRISRMLSARLLMKFLMLMKLIL